jgi:ACS family hexuronate transporter-like MFS transporter
MVVLMPADFPSLNGLERPRAWKWWVCGLLLLATMINYMDRVALNLKAVPILKEFGLNNIHYGYLESAFSTAFALGAILIGWLTDRWSVRWLYPAVVLVWSLAGVATGLAHGFAALLFCRFLLGLAESGNWPCALQTTKHLLKPSERTMGNGILQSGAALGAVLTPLAAALLVPDSGWRPLFVVIGLVGMFWGVAWLIVVRPRDLAIAPPPNTVSMMGVLGWLIVLYALDFAVHYQLSEAVWIGLPAPLVAKTIVTILGITIVVRWLGRATAGEEGVDRATFWRRFAVLAFLVVVINITWHFFRAWMPLFLQKQHGYTQRQMEWFLLGYYLSTDLGSIAAGVATLLLVRRGLGVHSSRLWVFGSCALVTTLSVAAAVLPPGPLLLGVLLVIGFACLGLFPNYYSFSQELTLRHQGKITGALGCICWVSVALMQEVVGSAAQTSGSYSSGMALVGLLPLVGLALLILFWDSQQRVAPLQGPDSGTIVRGKRRRKRRKIAR